MAKHCFKVVSDILSRLLFYKLLLCLLFRFTQTNTQKQDSGDAEKHKTTLQNLNIKRA